MSWNRAKVQLKRVRAKKRQKNFTCVFSKQNFEGKKIQNHSRHFLLFLTQKQTRVYYTKDKKMTTEEKTKEEEEIVPTKTAGAILFCGCTDFKNVGRTKQIDESVFANVNVPSKISTFEN